VLPLPPSHALANPLSCGNTNQGKHDAALAAVRGPLASAFDIAAEAREAEAALLLAKGELEAAAGLYEAALREQPDDWALLLLYLDALLPATASSLPACASTGVAQMVASVEATTRRRRSAAGGLAALMPALSLGGLPGAGVRWDMGGNGAVEGAGRRGLVQQLGADCARTRLHPTTTCRWRSSCTI
jgi:hypothetical protein